MYLTIVTLLRNNGEEETQQHCTIVILWLNNVKGLNKIERSLVSGSECNEFPETSSQF